LLTQYQNDIAKKTTTGTDIAYPMQTVELFARIEVPLYPLESGVGSVSSMKIELTQGAPANESP